MDKVACANCCDAVSPERVARRSIYCSTACKDAVDAWRMRELRRMARPCSDCGKPKATSSLHCDACRPAYNTEQRVCRRSRAA